MHVWQLDGYRPLATAPTGIATVSLEGEGFEEVATCDRLLADLDDGRERLNGWTVLVVDEAGMLGSRKLARLLEHAGQARAKVVVVGDDRQLAAIDAGGGFRALRHRLGASELTENRRQHQAWEREALELVRSGLVEEAVAAYRAHDRVVCAESKPAATLALLQDWWQAWQAAERDPGSGSLAGLRGVGFAVWSARADREARVLANAGVDVPAQRPVLLQDRPATAAAGGHRHPRGVAALSDRANIARGW
jgi:hypothetical protein